MTTVRTDRLIIHAYADSVSMWCGEVSCVVTSAAAAGPPERLHSYSV